ncbi:hypothetical protein I79_006295 [Cricetulus griseus]|uniref:Uncharacterized protein n=1 Tax=Cricetulus griseus TaxID=10029 RepID=G3H7G4_CRIGR|nr:hypothetical protein I79_006295 [Cricetulus griseus]
MDSEVKVQEGAVDEEPYEGAPSRFPGLQLLLPRWSGARSPRAGPCFLQEPPPTRPGDTAPAIFIRILWWQGCAGL